MKEMYTTIAQEAAAEIVEKRSRFIATVKPVATEEEALAFLNELRQKYWNATHNVYAYIIEENNIMRYNDDGEPGGTAGLPVLDMLKKEGLTNLIVVVTRYFGGVLLGTGGLVHAYSKSAKAGVTAAGLLDMILCRKISLTCEYTLLGKLQNLLSKYPNVILEEAIYTDKVELPLYLPVGEADAFCAGVIDKMNAQVTITQGETLYHGKKREMKA
ncbi:MAG: YigZ family protein [Clostridia bacterium]|nr:YigZ family protein [Clostridia bacterium]